jgi:hypothetical protein
MQQQSLIVTIVRKGWGSTVLEASVTAGAQGGTVLIGRGAGRNEQDRIFGVADLMGAGTGMTGSRAIAAD